MRITLVHSFYSSRTPSGENDVVVAQAEALERAGHTVTVAARHTDEDEKQPGYALKSGWHVASGHGPSPLADLSHFNPNVIHVHNLFPNFGTRWLAHAPVPVVASMHNYRQVCANGLLYRDGHVCFECRDSTMAAVRHSCYRQSRVATLPLAWSTRGGVSSSALLTVASAVVVPSERALSTFAELGVPGGKLRLIPYFIKDVQTPCVAQPKHRRWLVAGRLSLEKGVKELLAIWPEHEALDIAGSGPDEDELRRAAPPNVQFLGQLSQQELYRRLPDYEGLVFPGRSPEGIPTMVLHALAAGLPIVTRPGNGAGDLVSSAHVGQVYGQDTTTSLTQALDATRSGGLTLRQASRRCFEGTFTEDAWLESTLALYASLATAP